MTNNLKAILGFTFAITLLLGALGALSLDGEKRTFAYLGIDDKTLVAEDNCLIITPNWETMKKEEGIWGTLLHVNFPTGDKTTLVVRDSLGEPIRHKSTVGVNIMFTFTAKDIQNNYLFVPLEQTRSNPTGSIKVCAYFDTATSLTIYKDSELGVYKIPYFDCDGAVRKIPLADKYKVGQNTPIAVEFKNCGYADANLTVFYDNELFTKWFKLKEGQPSWNGNLAPGEDGNLVYNFAPLSAEEFIISPAIVEYNFNGYKFSTYSNPIIVGTSPYLETISCELFVDKRQYKPGETAKVEMSLYNDSVHEKDFDLVLNRDGRTEIKHVMLEGQRSTRAAFYFKEDSQKVSDISLTISKVDLNLLKTCGQDSIGFTEETTNYLPYTILLLVLVAIGTIVYYYYFL